MWMLESEPGHTQEQQMLLTTEPFFLTLKKKFFLKIKHLTEDEF